MKNVLQPYLNFLQRSKQTLPDDITQPYHKVIDFLFKIFSLWAALVGAFYIIFTPHCYFAFIAGEASESLSCTYTLGEKISSPVILEPGLAGELFLMQWLLGVGYFLIAIFVSQILVVRHLNETLPDHIYLRCFATAEEKKKRLPIK